MPTFNDLESVDLEADDVEIEVTCFGEYNTVTATYDTDYITVNSVDVSVATIAAEMDSDECVELLGYLLEDSVLSVITALREYGAIGPDDDTIKLLKELYEEGETGKLVGRIATDKKLADLARNFLSLMNEGGE